jgi:chromosome segregation ATPase
MPDSETSLQEKLSEARRELAASDLEVQRLRGLLVERDAELGKLKGKLAEFEMHLRRLMGAARRLSLLILGILRLPAAALRRLAGRRPPRG